MGFRWNRCAHIDHLLPSIHHTKHTLRHKWPRAGADTVQHCYAPRESMFVRLDIDITQRIQHNHSRRTHWSQQQSTQRSRFFETTQAQKQQSSLVRSNCSLDCFPRFTCLGHDVDADHSLLPHTHRESFVLLHNHFGCQSSYLPKNVNFNFTNSSYQTNVNLSVHVKVLESCSLFYSLGSYSTCWSLPSVILHVIHILSTLYHGHSSMFLNLKLKWFETIGLLTFETRILARALRSKRLRFDWLWSSSLLSVPLPQGAYTWRTPVVVVSTRACDHRSWMNEFMNTAKASHHSFTCRVRRRPHWLFIAPGTYPFTEIRVLAERSSSGRAHCSESNFADWGWRRRQWTSTDGCVSGSLSSGKSRVHSSRSGCALFDDPFRCFLFPQTPPPPSASNYPGALRSSSSANQPNPNISIRTPVFICSVCLCNIVWRQPWRRFD